MSFMEEFQKQGRALRSSKKKVKVRVIEFSDVKKVGKPISQVRRDTRNRLNSRDIALAMDDLEDE